jgi:hypothetical protein
MAHPVVLPHSGVPLRNALSPRKDGTIDTVQIQPDLFYNGRCDEAIDFYRACPLPIGSRQVGRHNEEVREPWQRRWIPGMRSCGIR